MVPFSAFTTAHWAYGSPRLERYNGQPSVELLGQAAPGLSLGRRHGGESRRSSPSCRPGIGYEWTGSSFEERRSGSQAPALYALSLLVVFLCLAALYESWSVPFAVMLVVPLGVLGALLAASGRGLSNDVYFQVGLLTTIGLSSKNAILIVEFAKAQMEQEGRDLIAATLEAVRMRLRPILMTSLAFGFGVLPLAHRHRRRFRQPERHRHRRARRHHRRHRARHLLRAAVLRGDQAHFQGQTAGGTRSSCCPAGAQVMTPLRTLTLALAAALASGCTLIPSYERPAAPVAAGFPNAAPAAAAATPADAIAWRDYFADARLREVIALALANNRDLRVAALNIEKARAQYRIQRADLFPAVGASGGQNAQRLPGDLTSSGEAEVNRSYSATIGFSAYELDFFGRIRSLNAEALETYLGTEEARRSAQISLVAEVANA